MNHQNYRTTTALVDKAHYWPAAAAFFGRFDGPFQSARVEILKLETRQTYREPGNPSWESMIAGDMNKAMRLLPATREEDRPFYADLRKRGVQFLRCRPVMLPLSRYLDWELACYDLNAAEGEDIRFVLASAVSDLLEYLHHDFVLVDDTVALVHDYDADGEIRGGWEVSEASAISSLRAMFDAFAARCAPYRLFLEERGVVLGQRPIGPP
jgi:hypothetical protein